MVSRNPHLWFGTSATVGATGAAAFVGTVALTGLQILLAVQTDTDIIRGIQSKCTSEGGMSIVIPTVTTTKSNLGVSTTQNLTMRFSPANGLTLQRVYTACYDASESALTAYGRNNTASAKVVSYYTALNTNRLQDTVLVCANADDYWYNRDFMKGTPILHKAVYNRYWVHVDDFCEFPAHTEARMPVPTENLIAGLPLSIDHRLEFNATTANLAFQWYQFAVTQRMLIIKGSSIALLSSLA
jgi:hypothetical protein